MRSFTFTFSCGAFNFLDLSLISVGVWTPAIACLPAVVADAISSAVVAWLMFPSCSFLTVLTLFSNSVFSDVVKPLSASISFFSASAASVKLALALSLTLAISTVWTSAIACLPSLVAVVTFSSVSAPSTAFSAVSLTLSTSFFFWTFVSGSKVKSDSISFFSASAAFSSSFFASAFFLSKSDWWTALIACSPFCLASSMPLTVVSWSILSIASFLALSTLSFNSFLSEPLKELSALMSSFSFSATFSNSAFAFSLSLLISVWTFSIAATPALVLSVTFSSVSAPSTAVSAFSFSALTLSSFVFLSPSDKVSSPLISAVSFSAASFNFSLASFLAFSNAFSAGVFSITVLSAVSSLCEPSEYVTVTFPFSSTEIWSSFNVGFAFLTASLTAVFSFSVRPFGLSTFTFVVGGFNGDFAASVPSTGTSTTSSLPSSYVTVTLTTSLSVLSAPPSALWFVPCTTFPPSTNSFVTPCGWSVGTVTVTASLIFCTSSAFVIVSSFLGTTLIFAVLTTGSTFDAIPASTVSLAAIVFDGRVWYVTVTSPFSLTVMLFSSNVGLACLTAFFTASFSFSVNLLVLLTFTFVVGLFSTSSFITSISISFETCSCVTFTGTYFLLPFSTIGL